MDICIVDVCMIGVDVVVVVCLNCMVMFEGVVGLCFDVFDVVEFVVVLLE